MVFWKTLGTFFNTASSQTLLFRRMLGSSPGQLKLQRWLSDGLTTRSDLIHGKHCQVVVWTH
jgi:hypothetical protein